MPGKKSPHDYGKRDQADASHRSACRIDARNSSAPAGAFNAGALLLDLLVLLKQRGARRKNCWKREKEAGNTRPKARRDEAGDSGYRSSKQKANGVLAPVRPAQGREVDLDSHRPHRHQRSQRPNAAPNQAGSKTIVVASAGHL